MTTTTDRISRIIAASRGTRIWLRLETGERVPPHHPLLAHDGTASVTVASSAYEMQCEELLHRVLPQLAAVVAVTPLMSEDAADGSATVALTVYEHGLVTSCIISATPTLERTQVLRRALASMLGCAAADPQVTRVPIVGLSALALASVPAAQRQRIVIDRAHCMGTVEHAAWVRFTATIVATSGGGASGAVGLDAAAGGVRSITVVGALTVPPTARGWTLAHVARCCQSPYAPDVANLTSQRALALNALTAGAAVRHVAALGDCPEGAWLLTRAVPPHAASAHVLSRAALHMAGVVALPDVLTKRDAAAAHGRPAPCFAVEWKTLEHFTNEDWQQCLAYAPSAAVPLYVVGAVPAAADLSLLIINAKGGERSLVCIV